MAVRVAYIWTQEDSGIWNDWSSVTDLSVWTLRRHDFPFLDKLNYNVWIKDDEYSDVFGRMDHIWLWIRDAAPTSTATELTQFTTDNTALTQQQSYAASFLARLAAFLLQTPRPQLKRNFGTLPCDLASLSLDPNSPKPDALTTRTCQHLIPILKFAMRASPDVVP
ncbi:hypothetical protein CC86DRAFT_461842 [Ophiobolus disseminans]|uniref:Uncharacterized protein n=1 Tax=Ophiobolus disseminans TaxID=1469910 RepID=A0A6A7ALB7_9PLEO|nr:hypothetical protein CC86DRAFT_461842 [Ophiobolus disseminans]